MSFYSSTSSTPAPAHCPPIGGLHFTTESSTLPATEKLVRIARRIRKAITAKWPQIGTVDLRLDKDNTPMGDDCKGAGEEMNFINK